MSPDAHPHLEALLTHRAWVRAVAHRLVQDPAQADDLEQDAWMAALRRPPDLSRDARPWLRRVLKNAASNRRRGNARRARRETAAHRERVTRTPDEILAETEQHQRVVQAVLALDEPFKTALVLRYYEGLSPKEIATQLSVAVGTVHSRLHRAIERLRAHLDRQEHGQRRQWMAALLPLAAGHGRTGAAAASIASAGGIAVTLSKSKLFALGALVLLLGLGVLALRLDDDDTSDARTSDPALLRADAPVELQGQGRPLVGADPIETPSDPAAPAPVGRTVTGRVLDPAGNPVAGAEVFALPVLSEGLDEQRLKEARFGRVRTDESGTFRTELGEMRRPVLAAYFEGFLPARARLPDAGEPVVLKLGPPRRLRVRVLDAQGRWPADTTVFAQTDANETFDRALDARRQSASAEHEQQVEGDEEVTLSIASLAPLEVDCRPPFGFAAVPAKVTIGPDVEAVTFRLVRSARIHIRAHPAPGSNAFPDRMRLSAYVYRHGTQEVVQSASRLSTKIDFVRSIGPGRYRIEVAAPHRATWIHEIEIERAGQEVELDVPLDLPVPGTELAQVRLRPRDVGTVPDDVRTLAAKVDSNERYVDWIVLTRQAGGDWEECFSTGTDDGEIELEGIEAGRLASGLPAGTYDFVVAQRGTGRAGVVEGIRVVSGQTHAIDVALEPGTFVQLPRVVSPDSAYTSIRFSTTKTGVLPAYAFPTRWSTVVYDWPKAMEHLTRVPLTPTVFGPFPGAHVTVTTQPTGVSVSVEGASRRRK